MRAKFLSLKCRFDTRPDLNCLWIGILQIRSLFALGREWCVQTRVWASSANKSNQICKVMIFSSSSNIGVERKKKIPGGRADSNKASGHSSGKPIWMISSHGTHFQYKWILGWVGTKLVKCETLHIGWLVGVPREMCVLKMDTAIKIHWPPAGRRYRKRILSFFGSLGDQLLWSTMHIGSLELLPPAPFG